MATETEQSCLLNQITIWQKRCVCATTQTSTELFQVVTWNARWQVEVETQTTTGKVSATHTTTGEVRTTHTTTGQVPTTHTTNGKVRTTNSQVRAKWKRGGFTFSRIMYSNNLRVDFHIMLQTEILTLHFTGITWQPLESHALFITYSKLDTRMDQQLR